MASWSHESAKGSEPRARDEVHFMTNDTNVDTVMDNSHASREDGEATGVSLATRDNETDGSDARCASDGI